MATYVIKGGEAGKRRLELLARTMGPTTDTFLERVGIRPGMRCLDLGCGAGQVTLRLAQLVGPTGSVVGLDFDAVKLEAARQEARQEGLENVEFRQGNVTEWSEPEAYDLVFGRYILTHLPNPEGILRTSYQALRADGILAFEDTDFSGTFCYPSNPAFSRYCELYRTVLHKRGGDADLGLRLYGLFLDAGMQDVDLRIVQLAYGGHAPAKSLQLITLENIGDALLSEGIVTAPEFSALIGALAAFTDDPRSIVGLPRMFQVWGRRGSGATPTPAGSRPARS